MKDRAGTLDRRMHAAFEWVVSHLPEKIRGRVRKATGGRLGIGTQIVVGLGGGALLTIGSIVVALALMGIVGGRQSEVTEQYMPGLVGAFDVAQSSDELVRATPRLVAASDPDALEAVMRDVDASEASLRAAVDAVILAAPTEATREAVSQEVVPLADSVLMFVNAIHESATRRMALQGALRVLDAELAGLSLDLQLQIEQELDDQHFFMYTGLRELGAPAAPVSQRRTEAELDHYSAVLNLKAYQNEASALIAQAMSETDPEVVRATSERVETALGDVNGALRRMRSGPRAGLQTLVERLDDLQGSPSGVFATRAAELEETAIAEELVASTADVTAGMVARIENMVEDAENLAQDAANRSSATISLGFWLLMGSVLFTIALAIFGWKFFGERLVVRMGRLSRATRRMSKGDLEVQVRIDGNDELTDMAGALEVFRQHAVEVQRLNLVEKLAAEIQAKNETLEETLDNLRRTQQQVVKQEKLASLGALTAGIAHEIRNPLNFVNNFAALSRELIDELREEMEDEDPDTEYVDEILGDLDTNVAKVNEHGARANRIVEGMLAHSRDEAGQVEPIDINQMVDEYAKLAYHGIRGTDATFNVDMVKEMDPTVGAVEGIARDLSRVLLNIVTNACHATHARRTRSLEEDYFPTVRIKTTGDEDSVKVSVRDNGTGIPDDVVQRIFDPFFTTKAGTGGTGLGLSISHEIIQEHGGKVAVLTEVGEFTEFLITLPRKGPLSTGISS